MVGTVGYKLTTGSSNCRMEPGFSLCLWHSARYLFTLSRGVPAYIWIGVNRCLCGPGIDGVRRGYGGRGMMESVHDLQNVVDEDLRAVWLRVFLRGVSTVCNHIVIV